MTRAVYPGSFDPITNGHLDIIKRSSHVFDEVVVAVSINPNKRGWFDMDERVEHIQRVVKELKNVKVKSLSGLLVDFMNKEDIGVIVKGLSSTAIKQVALFKGCLEGLVPKELESEIRQRAKQFEGEL